MISPYSEKSTFKEFTVFPNLTISPVGEIVVRNEYAPHLNIVSQPECIVPVLFVTNFFVC